MMMTIPISPEQIRTVSRLIDPLFLNSPVLTASTLDETLGCSLALKIETLNPIRSFKGRGTEALMASLTELPEQVVATSSGNFGQGLAWATTRRGVKATIFSGAGDNPLKLTAMRRLGADVRLVPEGGDGKSEAQRAAAEMGALLVEDGAHSEIAAGAGTIAVELLEQAGALEIIVVQIGDGALIAGVGSWIRAMSPATRIVGVTAAQAPAMRASIEKGEPVSALPRTIADGLAIYRPVATAVEEVRAVVDEIIEVEENAILDAMALLLGRTGLVAEPSGAVGVAAIMCRPDVFRGRTVGSIITGSNIRPDLLQAAASRGALV
jgi:threonine dehydratase